MKAPTPSSPIPTYRRPSWIMRHLVDPLTRVLVGKLGLDDHTGTRVLEVQGRTSGHWHTTPVKLLEWEGHNYLVAMYGETNWVKNLRAQRHGRIRLGGHVTEFRVVELSDADKLSILRTYLKRYWSLVARMTTLTSADAPTEELARVAPLHPVFRLETR